MSDVTDHYEKLLAPIYLWMAGGAEAALAQGAAELAALGIAPSHAEPAVDLGAGFGMHSIPLARLGYMVTAIDSSAELLAQLKQLEHSGSETMRIRTVEADLLDFQAELNAPQALILCMGDTLTHLPTAVDVELLCVQIAGSLRERGRFIATFRDYTRPAAGAARFIAVRSDADRIHTCFLEAEDDRMMVHDIVHERRGSDWSMRVSRYPKLRLDPARVERLLTMQGLEVSRETTPRGMVRIVATRPEHV